MLKLFAQNLLETATVAAPGNRARLFDREASVLYAPPLEQSWDAAQMFSAFPPALAQGPVAGFDIDVDLWAPAAVSAWALVNPAVDVAVTLYAGDSFPPSTQIDTVAGATSTFLRTFATSTFRYWRVRVAGGPEIPTVGELLLGVPRQIAMNPTVESAGRRVIGNVARDQTPTGVFRTVKRGPSRVRLEFAWRWMPADDYDELVDAYHEAGEGARSILVQDELGVLRWMQITTAELEPRPIQGPSANGGLTTEIALTLEEAL